MVPVGLFHSGAAPDWVRPVWVRLILDRTLDRTNVQIVKILNNGVLFIIVGGVHG